MLRYSIRDVLWLTLLVATSIGIYVAWRKDHQALERERATLQQRVQAYEASARAESNEIADWANQLRDPVMMREVIIALKAEKQLRDQKERQAALSAPNPNP